MSEQDKQNYIDDMHGDGDFRSGFVTLVGRPNSGKSTLLNTVVGKKVAITSDTAQTTRHRFRAILSNPRYQLVLVDTPGLHKPHDALGKELNVAALKSLSDVDVVAFLVDAASPVGTGDAWVAKHLETVTSAKVAVLTKVDLVDELSLEKQREAISTLGDWDAVISLSAITKNNIDTFVHEIVSLLPSGPQWFPENMDTDQQIEVLVAEFIREKILRSFYDEIPHAIGVVADEMEYDRKKKLYRIFATIYVEHESQKGMLIGKGGKAIKTVGSEARQDLEQLLGTRVYLDLKVKVKKNWRKNLQQIKRFGYGEGAY